MSEAALNPRQRTFVRELASGKVSQAEAYRRAGYSHNGARVSASQLLANPNVRKALDRLERRGADNASVAGDSLRAALDRLSTHDWGAISGAELVACVDKLADLRAKLLETSGDSTSFEDQADEHVAWTRKAILTGARLAARYGPARVLRRFGAKGTDLAPLEGDIIDVEAVESPQTPAESEVCDDKG